MLSLSAVISSEANLDRNQINTEVKAFLTTRGLLTTLALNAHIITLSSLHVCASHISFYIHALSMIMHAHARHHKLQIL